MIKKIGIDARLYSQTGVGVYIRNLLYYLNETRSKEYLFYVYLLNKDFDTINFSNQNIVKRRADYYWHTFGEQTSFLKILNGDKLDLMHFTYFSFPILYMGRYIATIHDLTPLYFKTGKASTKNPFVYYIKHLIFKQVLETQVIKAKKIITPTRTVKSQLIRHYHDSGIQSKVFFLYEGVNHEFYQARENKALARKFNGKFFIYVGNFYPHKNIEKLITAFSHLKNNDYKLILVGPKDFFVVRLLKLITALKQKERIKLYHNQSINDLVFFYRRAVALIHPSISEGFGLPIVEAMYFGLPIIASDIPVFKELIGDGYLKFSPGDSDDITKKLEDFIAIKKNYNFNDIDKKYSFKNMTQKTLDIYKKALI